MNRWIIAVVAGGLLYTSSAARAERSYSARPGRMHSILVGVDTDVAIPLGNYGDVNSVGVGALLAAEYPLVDTFSATLRVGFQMHADRTVAGLSSHVHAIPVLLGTRYHIGGERRGLFGAFEVGIFDLIGSADRRAGGNTIVTDTSNSMKFGLGVGVGYQQDRWDARVNVHTQDVGNFGSAMTLSAGLGYQFAAF
jgi:hypothetical protein